MLVYRKIPISVMTTTMAARPAQAATIKEFLVLPPVERISLL